MIRYGEVLAESIVDGVGLRVVVFLQGCPRHCSGCHNPSLLSADGGNAVTEEELAEIILSKVTPLHRGITFSGGDPLMQAESLYKVIKIIQHKNPKLNIWVYTGYIYEEVCHLPVLNRIDVLVDGPFIAAEKDLRLVWRGSANQRVINVPLTKENGRVIEVATKMNSVIISRAI
ncbi:MAG: anaerobic ribonucleoside-triphosphate reductase activating protein [Pelosinus sp.]|nr:anaerobic ribonucleoside-triphosphate reductase activating protein [Pelosinus sp.]